MPRPFRFGIQCKGPAEGPAWAAHVRKVEDLGWSVLTVADHFDEGLAPIPALVAAADATTTLTVGTMVLANDYRHPVVVAEAVPVADQSAAAGAAAASAPATAATIAAATMAMRRLRFMGTP